MAEVWIHSNGSFAGSMEVSGPEWVIDSALDERGAVLAVLPDENEAKLVRPDEYKSRRPPARE